VIALREAIQDALSTIELREMKVVFIDLPGILLDELKTIDFLVLLDESFPRFWCIIVAVAPHKDKSRECGTTSLVIVTTHNNSNLLPLEPILSIW
jgi:hypothetical protein